jgi:hypothetical protein
VGFPTSPVQLKLIYYPEPKTISGKNFFGETKTYEGKSLDRIFDRHPGCVARDFVAESDTLPTVSCGHIEATSRDKIDITSEDG